MVVSIDHFDQFVELMGDFATTYGGWPNDTLIIAMMNSTHAFAATDTSFSDVSANQIAAGNGYTQADGAGAGETLASVTSSQPSAGVWMLDAADASWTASGGSIPSSGDCTDAVVFDDTITSPANALMFDIDFGGAQSAGVGTDFVISWDANGICRIT